MASINIIFILGIVMQSCVLVHPSATVEFWFKTWSNTDHSLLYGGCCDGFFGCKKCDNSFIVCLDEDESVSTDFNDCDIASITTDEVYGDNDDFTFPSVIPNNIANPKALSVINYQGNIRIKLKVYDEDFIGEELVEKDFLNIAESSYASQSVAQWTEYTMGTHTVFKFGIRVYCDPDYYSSDCSVFCVATDNHNGHYSCDPVTGDKICDGGWEGVDCKLDTDECMSGPCLHDGTCHNGMNEFSCTCTDGWTGERCDVDVDQCEINPCLNNGTCNDFPGFFNCSCDPDYSYVDDLCQIDHCADQPCLNGSTCNNLVANFSCACAVGFQGDACDVDIDECAGAPCENGGNCTDGLGWYNCTCPPGYRGDRCETDIDECQSNPCFDGATCEDLVGEFVCRCPVGLGGTLCSEEIDECESAPCQNNATCADYTGYFVCICPNGFFGDLCEVDIDYCLNQTCANNGTCVDRLDGFHCLCATGYEGAGCEIEIDECSSAPCMHNATCLDLIGEYRCLCSDGYESVDCELETDECLSSPCTNDATCIDEVAGFHCQCPAGYEGTHCELETDECLSFPCYANETCIDIVNGFRCTDGVDMCESKPCQNNGICHDDDTGPGFSCQCLPGFGGDACQDNLDECLSSPCLHGTCQDGVNAFTCHCETGYEGTLCEIDTDECASSPCEYGSCVDLVNGFECVCMIECVNGQCVNGACLCTDGFEGDDCNTEIDYCSSSPCNTGTCVPLFNSFRCECDPIYEGEYCEKLLNPCSLSPCANGKCTPSQEVHGSYNCTCNDSFYGVKCDVALKDYGCVLLLVGASVDVQEFEKNMAGLLNKLMTASLRSRDGIRVDVVKTEDYYRADNGEPLTRVTYVARASSGYLPHSEVEKTVDEAPPKQVKEQLGQEMYTGKAGSKPPSSSQQSWASSHWYVFLIVVVVIVAMAAIIGAGFLRPRFKKRFPDRKPLTVDEEDDGHYNVLSDLGQNPGYQTDDGATANPVATDEPCYAHPYETIGGDKTENTETAISNNLYYMH